MSRMEHTGLGQVNTVSPATGQLDHQAREAHEPHWSPPSTVAVVTQAVELVDRLEVRRQPIPDYASIRARVNAHLPTVPHEMREAVAHYLESSPTGVSLPSR